MSAWFTASSTQYLLNASPSILDYPITVGGWVSAAADTTNRMIWALSDTGTATNYLSIRKDASDTIQIGARAGGVENNVSVGTALTGGTWAFFVARFVNSTLRRISVLHQRLGVAQHSFTTTARAPTGLDSMSIGALKTSGGITEPFDGLLGEIWYANADIQADGAQTQAGLFWQLAYGGPFSVPHIAKNIIEYHSLRVCSDQLGEAFRPQTWSNVNAVATGQHPPLPYWYAKPDDSARVIPATQPA